MNIADIEIVDDVAGLIIRRVVVGALDTNCWIVAVRATGHAIVTTPVTSQTASSTRRPTSTSMPSCSPTAMGTTS